MNLHSIVSRAISAVNSMTCVEVFPNTGYVTGADGRQSPVYGTPYTLFAQVQQFTSTDLRKMDGLNIQGAGFSIFINGQWNGVVRTAGKGGDLMKFRGQTWLVVAVLEQWPDWSKLGVVLQNDGGP
jgi:hypothetical protein